MLASEFRQFNEHVGCVTETWFNEQMSSNYVDIDGYSLYRRDRKKRKGGGVYTYIHIYIHVYIYTYIQLMS